MSGLELAAELKRRGSTARIVILTTFARPGYLRRALDAGASGYLLKDAPSHRLADAIRRVRNGGRAVDPELASEAWSDEDPLTDRERQVLRLAADGQSGADIADALHLSEGTVRNYLSEAGGQARRAEQGRCGANRAGERVVVNYDCRLQIDDYELRGLLRIPRVARRRHKRHERIEQARRSRRPDESRRCRSASSSFPNTFISST